MIDFLICSLQSEQQQLNVVDSSLRLSSSEKVIYKTCVRPQHTAEGEEIIMTWMGSGRPKRLVLRKAEEADNVVKG